MERRGFTLIETLVIMGIVALLMALLIPAVQAARNAAAATQCRNNLRQMILAVGNYESQHGMYPNGMYAKVALLPYLEQRPIPRVNLDSLPSGDPLWAEAAKANLPIYHCPADPAPDVLEGEGTSNYATCYGSGLLVGGFDGAFGYWEDIPVPPYVTRSVKSSDLRDGTSSTAGISEWLHSDGTFARLRVRWETPNSYSAAQVDTFQTLCESLPIDPIMLGWVGSPVDRGAPWLLGGLGQGQYNHMLPPNRPNCKNQGVLATGIHTAASMHSGGAHVAFMDGHVTFTNENIDLRAWQRLGSRDDKAAGL